MASSPYQKIISSTPPVQCGRNHESKRRPFLLFRLKDEDGICYQDHEVLPHRSWPPSNHPRIPMVCSQPTKDRLGQGMDRCLPSPSHHLPIGSPFDSVPIKTHYTRIATSPIPKRTSPCRSSR